MKSNKKAVITTLITAYFCISVGAQESVTEGADVTVTASPITQHESVDKEGRNISIIGRTQIDRLNAKELPSALRQVPGVTISRYNQLGSYGGESGGSVYIRGQGAGRPGSEIKMYSDGAPRESGVWAHPIMDMVPVDFANAITVHKGPQPQAFSGTFGAVNIESLRRIKEGFETEVNLAYGSHDTMVGSLSHGGKNERFDYYVGASHKESDGHRKHGDASMDNQFVRLGVEITDNDSISYILQRTDNWSRDPGRIDEPTPSRNKFATETLTHVLRMDNDHDSFKGFLLAYYDKGQIRWAKDNLDGSGTPAGSSDTDWDNYGVRSFYDVPMDRLTLSAGLDIESCGGETRNVLLSGMVPWGYDDRFTTVSPYLGTRYDFDIQGATLTPSLGARYHDNSEFDSEIAPCAAITLVKNGVQIFASYARGVNYPGVYASGTSASTMHQLEAELIDNVEAGFRVEFSKVAVMSASVFHYEGDNLLQRTAHGMLNVGKVEVDGAELAVHITPTENLSIFAGLTYLDPDKENAPRMPEISASVGVSCKITRFFKLDLDAEYVDEQYAYNGRTGTPSPSDLEKVASRTVANARLSFDLASVSGINGELFFGAENITDEDYEFLPGYPMPGTTYSAGLRMKF